jgi:shikimate kinase
VICPAASTVDDPACRKALLEGTSLLVWLTARPATAASRFDHQGHRPRYGEDTEAFLARQAIERGPRFRSLGPVELATDELPAEDLAAEVMRLARGGA